MKDFKEIIIQSYLRGIGSYRTLSIEYGIGSESENRTDEQNQLTQARKKIKHFKSSKKASRSKEGVDLVNHNF